MDTHNNEKGQDLDKYQDKGGSYVPLCPLPHIESNRPTNLGERTKILNYLVCISKLSYLVIANFALEFSNRRGSKTKKHIYTSRLQEKIEFHIAFITSTVFTTSITSGIINPHGLIKDCLESCSPSNHRQGLGIQLRPNQWQDSWSYLASTTSSSFTYTFKISNVTSLPIKSPVTGNSLWQGYCCCTSIKDHMSSTCSLCKYT